uniref:Polyhomeotic homolog 1 n=1 Tax=Gasterosteus aculeatus aculeatus TaxID=481459 RepID=G3NB87_GASAC
METDGEQNQQGASTNGSAASGTSSRPSPMNSMSLYERQAVQALQALQRQPNAAQYFQQLMLQQQISNAQFQNLAAVQQATMAASRQSSASGGGSSQTTEATLLICQASVTSGSTTNSRPLGNPSTISQSVVLSGTAGAQGQMYLRVNRSLRTPISSQLIFMPGSATVGQQPQAKQEVTPTSSASGQSDNDQVQNLAMRGVSTLKGVGVKTEAPERSDSGKQPFLLMSISHTANKPGHLQQPPPHIKIPTYPQPTNLKAQPSSSSTATSSIPLSQLLLHGTRTLTAGTTAPTAPTAARALLLTSGTASQPTALRRWWCSLCRRRRPVPRNWATDPSHPTQTLQGLRLPLQLPSRNPPPILPAPPPVSSSAPPQTPHIPVQIVGARQSMLGNTQALALARGSCCRDGSSSLLTMLASVTSREGAAVCRGAGLKALQSPQEAPPVAQVSQVPPEANQSSGPGDNGPLASGPASSQAPGVSAPPTSTPRSSLSLPLVTEEQRGASAALPVNGDSSRSQTSQVSVPFSSSSSPVLPPSRGVCQGERAPPPQAVVKPNVLTHLIEGFVIQEGAEPFPVSVVLTACSFSLPPPPSVLKCEYCKNFAPASQFRGTKRFCSMSCAKRYNVSFRQHFCVRLDQGQCQGQLSNSDEEAGIARRRVPRRTSSEIASAKIAGRPLPDKCHSESSHSDEESSGEEDEDDPVSLSSASSASCRPPPPPLPTESSAPGCPPSGPAQWGVEEVTQFISSLQGCEELASQFLSQEIDGQALLLLKEEHLMSTMNIKLGPALKICAHINALRD